jgi:hypothetical protein
MEHQDVKDAMLVDRYLAGNLTAREREAFETHYLSCTACLEELELTEKLRQGARDTVGGATEGSPDTKSSRTSQLAKTVLRTRRYATAATVLFAVSLLVSGRLYQQLLLPDPLTGAQVVPIHATRGSASRPANVVHLRSTATTIILLIDPGPAPLPEYRVTVLKVTGDSYQKVTLLDGLKPTYEQMVAVSMPGTTLESGDYLLSLDGKATPDQEYRPVTELSFTVEID